MRTRLLLFLFLPGASCLAVSVLLGLGVALPPLPAHFHIRSWNFPHLPSLQAFHILHLPPACLFLARQPKSNSPKILPHQISFFLITIILHL